MQALHFLKFNQEAVGFYFDVLTFLTSAFIISRLALPHLTRRQQEAAHGEEHTKGIDWAQGFHQLTEGWHFIFMDPVVRAVMIGLGTGLIGGGMLLPLGPVFTKVVLRSGNAGFGLLLSALGVVGVADDRDQAALSIIQNRLPPPPRNMTPRCSSPGSH